jgi:hypothetical protein
MSLFSSISAQGMFLDIVKNISDQTSVSFLNKGNEATSPLSASTVFDWIKKNYIVIAVIFIFFLWKPFKRLIS